MTLLQRPTTAQPCNCMEGGTRGVCAPIQMVRKGIAMKTGVVIAPTV